jgi:hypothetical protein
MSFSNTTTFSTAVGNDVDTTFVLQFYYELGDTQFIEVNTYDITDPANPVIDAVPLPFNIDETNYPNTQIIFDDPLPSDRRVVIARVTDTGQPSVFSSGPFPAAASEYTYDYLAQKIQENFAALENAGISRYWETSGLIVPPPSGAVTFNFQNVSAASYNAAASDLVVLRAATATNVVLPASPSTGDRVDVVCGVPEFNNKTIDANGSTILGEGAIYTFTSDYESLTLAYSGSDWVIV